LVGQIGSDFNSKSIIQNSKFPRGFGSLLLDSIQNPSFKIQNFPHGFHGLRFVGFVFLWVV